MLGRCLLVTGLLILAPAVGQACSIPVFRYALERWQPSPYDVLIFHRGPLEFAKDMWEADEPSLWQKDYTGRIAHWIEVGQPDEKRILRACGRADQVLVYAYSQSTPLWWKPLAGKLERARNLTVRSVAPSNGAVLSKLAGRAMDLQCTIHEGEIWMRSEDVAVNVDIATLMAPPAGR